jgi:hypothetical protein
VWRRPGPWSHAPGGSTPDESDQPYDPNQPYHHNEPQESYQPHEPYEFGGSGQYPLTVSVRL